MAEADLVPVKRALLSVSDKTGLLDFARALVEEFKVELISTGGTAKFLRDAGLKVTDVSDVTGFPEMMDGRVKTLHPKIHGGLLALRDNSEHLASMKQHGIAPIDLVCINLYPFAQTIAKSDVSFEEAIENIDIGGPSMIRSAAKNHRWVLVCTSPDRYEKVLGDLRQHGGASCGKHRLKMAQRAFAHTAEYDATIAGYLADGIGPATNVLGSTGGAPSRFSDVPHEGMVALATEDRPPERTQSVPAAIPRQRLLQKLLGGAGDLSAFLEALIQAQGVVVAGTEAAAFLVEREGSDIKLRPMAHVRPDDASSEVKAKALQAFAEIVQPCVQQGKDGVIEVDASKKDTVDPQFCLVTLLRSDNQVVGVTAVIARAANIARAQQRLSTMELVAGYFEMWTLRHAIDQARSVSTTHQSVLQLATTVATAEGFDAAAMGLCNELAARTGSTRVAIGWVEGFPPKIKLKAMSHTEKFDKKQELAVLIIAAMEECLDQEDIVHYDADGETGSRDKVTRAAAELSRTQGGVGVLSLPLRRAGDITGVILMEFNPQRKLPQDAETALAVAVELLGPQLFDRYQNDRWWIVKMVAGYFERFTPRHGSAGGGLEAHESHATAFPKTLKFKLSKAHELRYGENPHQSASLYVADKPKEPSVAFAKQHHGKELSYINLLDADAVLSCVKEFHAPAACIVKHATPCGVATADSIGEAFERAYECDPLAAFGGIVAFNKPIDRAAAEGIAMIDKMLEVIVAPHFADDALELLRSRWKNVRLLEVGPVSQGRDDARPAARIDRTELHLHKIVGGYLVQERDLIGIVASEWKCSTSREPTARELIDLRFAWLACKHVKSNAIVLAKDRATIGIGGGAVDRVGAARIAIEKAGDRAHGSVAASDAFFPFPDGPKLLIEAGVTAIVQPGGSVRDADSIAAADEAGVAMILTGRRHFRH